MRAFINGLLAVAALTALSSAPAKAANTIAPLVDGAGWSTFYFGSPYNYPDFQDINGTTIDFTFTLTQTDVLRVTDGYNDGDEFEVAIFNTATGFDVKPTSSGVFDGTNVLDCWSCAFFDPNYSSLYSHAEFILGPGTYNVSGAVTYSPFGSGEGAIELGAVPEPATWAMMLAGFGGLGLAMRRARRKALASATA
jgi:hypothetical protein